MAKKSNRGHGIRTWGLAVGMLCAWPCAAETLIGDTVNAGGERGQLGPYSVQSTVGQPVIGPGTASTSGDFAGAGFAYLLVKPFSLYSTDDFTTGQVEPPGSLTGWSSFGMENELASTDYGTTEQAYRLYTTPSSNKFRISGLLTNLGEWLPYSEIGPNRHVRAKFYVYADGMVNESDLNEIPNLRMRLANRFAVNSMLEVFHHTNDNPAQTAMDQELRPSLDAAKPSLYRVDYDVIDVPYLQQNAGLEGVLRGIEAYSIFPQENGYIAMTESSVGTYPADLLSTAAAPVRAYNTGTTDAGELKQFDPAETELFNLVPSPVVGDFGGIETTGPVPTYAESNAGITLATAVVPTDRVGIGIRNFNIDGGTVVNFAARPRVAPGQQYTVRFHLTSTQQVNQQCQIRLRARSVKFAWSQKFEIGGAFGTGAGSAYPLNANNTIAQQSLPGVGTENPDREPGDTTGGWYTIMLHTPLSRDIRTEFAAEATMATRMPNIMAQPGPGADLFSRRDIFCGIDIVDSLSGGAGRFLESGVVTVDKVEIRAFDLVGD